LHRRTRNARAGKSIGTPKKVHFFVLLIGAIFSLRQEIPKLRPFRRSVAFGMASRTPSRTPSDTRNTAAAHMML
jgi:hypothetical protein